MIKYFCDRCNKEIEYHKQFKINTEPPFSSLYCSRSFIVCEDCMQEIEKFIQGKKYG